MANLSEVLLTIEGKNEDVQKVLRHLTDLSGCFNPFLAFSLKKFYKQTGSFIYPESNETDKDFEKRMLKNYDSLEKENTRWNTSPFKIHQGVPIDGSNFLGELVTKASVYFSITASPLIREFVTISRLFPFVGFLLQFDSDWQTHYGKVYIHNGKCAYATYLMHFYDINVYDIQLSTDGIWKYITKDRSDGNCVPFDKLKPITESFIDIDPAEMKYIYTYFPSYMDKYEGLEPDEILLDDYIPNIYNP